MISNWRNPIYAILCREEGGGSSGSRSGEIREENMVLREGGGIFTTQIGDEPELALNLKEYRRTKLPSYLFGVLEY